MAFRTNKTPDLQEKSASGSVATFNTALAMPLSSCNIAVNAWQEGSGDPSPVNDRPIHGFSEVNVTANNVVHTIQLGQEVYGAEVDVVNGVAHVTHGISTIPTITSFNEISGVRYGSYRPSNILQVAAITNDIISEVGYGRGFNKNFSVFHNSLDIFHTVDDDYTVADYNENIAGNHDIYPLATPFDIQLTPTQIETLIGNNTIFADTGDVDLTYKDLDIAKRGNFREVFKLPS